MEASAAAPATTRRSRMAEPDDDDEEPTHEQLFQCLICLGQLLCCAVLSCAVLSEHGSCTT